MGRCIPGRCIGGRIGRRDRRDGGLRRAIRPKLPFGREPSARVRARLPNRLDVSRDGLFPLFRSILLPFSLNRESDTGISPEKFIRDFPVGGESRLCDPVLLPGLTTSTGFTLSMSLCEIAVANLYSAYLETKCRPVLHPKSSALRAYLTLNTALRNTQVRSAHQCFNCTVIYVYHSQKHTVFIG